jgi:replicative DNA helicase
MNTLASPAAEKALLGCMLIDPDVIPATITALPLDAFYDERHAAVANAIRRLDRTHQAIDTVTIWEELSPSEQDQLGGPSYLLDLSLSTPSSLNVREYLTIVQRLRDRRYWQRSAQRLVEAAHDETRDPSAIAAEILRQAEPSNNGAGLHGLTPTLQAILDRLERLAQDPTASTGIKLGYRCDDIIGGIQPGDLTIIAGRPGMGKSAFALNIALNMTQAGKHVGFFSLEMGKEQLVERLLAIVAGVENSRYHTGRIYDEEWEATINAANLLANLPLYIDDETSSLNALEAAIRSARNKGELDVAMIDYMQLIRLVGSQTRFSNRQEEVSHIARYMKGMARDLNLPIIALAQLSRAVESRANKRPMLSDLRESGAIEQEADQVLFLYRDDYYDESSEAQNILEVIAQKNRHGATGTASLYFRRELMRITDLEIQRTDLTY